MVADDGVFCYRRRVMGSVGWIERSLNRVCGSCCRCCCRRFGRLRLAVGGFAGKPMAAGLRRMMEHRIRCSGGALKPVGPSKLAHVQIAMRRQSTISGASSSSASRSHARRLTPIHATIVAPDPYHPTAQTAKSIAAGALFLRFDRIHTADQIRISSDENSSDESSLLPSSSSSPAKLPDGENPSRMGVPTAAVDKIYLPQIRSDLHTGENPTIRPLPSSPATNNRYWGKTIRSGIFSTQDQNPSVSADACHHLDPRPNPSAPAHFDTGFGAVDACV
ncbi:hypothetical protein ACLOJK_000773 [Asimina triloba]